MKRMCDAIRGGGAKQMITVGVIPCRMCFRELNRSSMRRAFTDCWISSRCISIRRRAKSQKALDALEVYKIGKPVVIEEFFPLACSIEEAAEFFDRSEASGVVSFYWGKTIEENEQSGDIKGAIVAAWLKYFQQHAAAQTKQAPSR